MADHATDCAAGAPGAPLAVDAARLRTLAAAAPVAGAEALTLLAGIGRVAARDHLAATAQPPFDNAAMDGYALSTADLHGPGPYRLRLAARIAAGDARRSALGPGEAARIFTGAPIPAGADAVVMQERTTAGDGIVTLDAAPAPGLNIRRQGEDRAAGAVTVRRGQVLTPPRLALLAATGLAEVEVVRRVRIGLLSTGDELAEPGAPLRPGQIHNSNRVMLAALLSAPWAEVTDLGIVRDDPAALRRAIREAAATQDAVISSGGVSAGEEDHILDALRREAAELAVLKVAIRPGKPLTVGRLGAALYIGLPGNPWAAAVTFAQIARPALRRMAGMTETPETWLPGVAAFDYPRAAGRREFVPVTWERRDPLGRPVLERLGRGASASLGPLAVARGIAEIPAEMTRVTPGTVLTVEPLHE